MYKSHSFILYILQRFIFSLKNNHYAYILSYMYKAFPTLGNKNNSKLNFTKNRLVSLLSCGQLKTSRCSIALFYSLNRASTQKVRLHHCIFNGT